MALHPKDGTGSSLVAGNGFSVEPWRSGLFGGYSSMGRVRVYDAEGIARDIRETFTAKKVRESIDFSFTWPAEMQHVGDSLGVAYSSDKWKDDGDMETYKHIAESRNRALCKPGFLVLADNASKSWPTIGPMVSFDDFPMPKDFAELALFEEVDLKLYTKGTNEDPKFGRGKD